MRYDIRVATMTDQLRLDALVRVSREGGRGEYLRSPHEQLDSCERGAASLGAVLVNRETPPAVDVSGGTMDREDIRTILERLQAGTTDGVIMSAVDRFSRAPIEEGMAVFRQIQRAGGHFVVAETGVDIRPGDVDAETLHVINMQQAYVQREKMKKRWATARGNAVKSGKAMGVPPFGCRFAAGSRRGDGAEGLAGREPVGAQLQRHSGLPWEQGVGAGPRGHSVQGERGERGPEGLQGWALA